MAHIRPRTTPPQITTRHRSYPNAVVPAARRSSHARSDVFGSSPNTENRVPTHRRGGAVYDSARVTAAGPLPPAIRIQRILGSQPRRMEVVQAVLPAETSA